MANNKSAEKRNRQREKRRLRNRLVLGSMRTAVKKARSAIEGKNGETPELVRQAVRYIDKAVTKGSLHRRTGARLVARLARRASATSASSAS